MSQYNLSEIGRLKERQALLSVQYLRGMAALSVASIHALDQVVGRSQTTLVQFLRSGVDFAFVISGFIMCYVLMKRPLSPLEFLVRRVVRIVPLYWVVTSFMVGMMIIAPHMLQSGRFNVAHVVASYAFLPWPSPAVGGGMRPVLMPGWTLNYEMFFYLLVASALFLPRRVQKAVTGTLLVAFATAGHFLHPLGSIAGFYANPLLVEFALGVGIATVVERTGSLPNSACVAMIFIGVWGLCGFGNYIDLDESNRLLVFGIPVSFIIAGAILLERQAGMPRIGLLKVTGDASYSIYLTHTLLLSALAQMWKRTALAEWPPGLFVCVSLPASLIFGICVNILIEKPGTRLLAKWLRGRRAASARVS